MRRPLGGRAGAHEDGHEAPEGHAGRPAGRLGAGAPHPAGVAASDRAGRVTRRPRRRRRLEFFDLEHRKGGGEGARAPWTASPSSARAGAAVALVVGHEFASLATGMSVTHPRRHALLVIATSAVAAPLVLATSREWHGVPMQLAVAGAIAALDWFSFHEDNTRFSERPLCLLGNCRVNAMLTGALAHLGDVAGFLLLLWPATAGRRAPRRPPRARRGRRRLRGRRRASSTARRARAPRATCAGAGARVPRGAHHARRVARRPQRPHHRPRRGGRLAAAGGLRARPRARRRLRAPRSPPRPRRPRRAPSSRSPPPSSPPTPTTSTPPRSTASCARPTTGCPTASTTRRPPRGARREGGGGGVSAGRPDGKGGRRRGC